jgi:hypothetical protein
LTCSITTPSVDPEGSTVTYTYAWTRNGTPFANTAATLPGANTTTQADLWGCTATPSDGALSGPSASASRRIAQKFSYTYSGNADALFTAPTWAAEITAKLWGAAGGGGSAENGSHRGGAGGYVGGRFAVTAGQQLSVKVGRGGGYGASFTYEAWPNGGMNSERSGYNTGGGGGRSALLSGSTEVFVAGGGGGGGGTGWNCGANNLQGGGGGYPAGGDGGFCANGSGGNSNGCQGRGGSQSSGGTSTPGARTSRRTRRAGRQEPGRPRRSVRRRLGVRVRERRRRRW